MQDGPNDSCIEHLDSPGPGGSKWLRTDPTHVGWDLMAPPQCHLTKITFSIWEDAPLWGMCLPPHGIPFCSCASYCSTTAIRLVLQL